MKRDAWIRLAIFALFAAPLASVVLSEWRFRWVSGWRMDPIPFGFFMLAAFFLGRYFGSRRRRDP